MKKSIKEISITILIELFLLLLCSLSLYWFDYYEQNIFRETTGNIIFVFSTALTGICLIIALLPILHIPLMVSCIVEIFIKKGVK